MPGVDTAAEAEIVQVCFRALKGGDTAVVFAAPGLEDSAGGGIAGVTWSDAALSVTPLQLGDVNGDWTVDLDDANLVLQIVAGRIPAQTVYLSADVNGDGKIGTEEAA